MHYQMIASQADLNACLNALDPSQPLCLDTEFMRVRTYNPQLALVQLTTGQDIYLIDPLAVADLEPLWQRLVGAETKVLHACGEDLDVLPSPLLPLFDTQVAATLCNKGMSLGYAALVEQEFGVTLDKGQSRTDWLKRPLTEAQLAYCVNDVLYLPELHQRLDAALIAIGRRAWLTEECERQVSGRARGANPELAYIDIKNAWQLGPQNLAVLRELAGWRLGEAKRRDLALNFVIREENLWAIAKRLPERAHEIKSLVAPQEWRHHGQALQRLVEQGMNVPSSDWPAPIVRLIDLPDYKEQFAAIKDKVALAAEKTGLPEAFIGSKKLINDWYSYHYRLSEQERESASIPVLQSGWRQEVLGSLK
ncbi:ribonuclease D [Gallaecimonas pentaromativorans]|uniref:Ribonuclease D n=1 Tax=Gallaecimonas pentaromativorans TaxID=584787 RepID=A0A3N1PPJ4_9GAMM|nr:ribonuclease D [Gallaecimonas pentaromativorans]ROQ30109.1 ribonuclease D [Gallaecimonas pentaromativorans]